MTYLNNIIGRPQPTVSASSPPAFEVTVHTTASTLEKDAVNEVTASNTYTLPLASSVNSNDSLIVELSETYADFTPIISRGGSDDIRYKGGLVTTYTLDSGKESIRFISNGVDEWRI